MTAAERKEFYAENAAKARAAKAQRRAEITGQNMHLNAVIEGIKKDSETFNLDSTISGDIQEKDGHEGSNCPDMTEPVHSSGKMATRTVNPDAIEEIKSLVGRRYSIPEVAAAIGVTARTVKRYIKDGKLHAKKIGGGWRISGGALKRFMDDEAE
jgi:excisionase family DNA binding protein